MSTKPEESRIKKTVQAVCVVKTGENLCQAFNLTIVDGEVVSTTQLTRADDMPQIAIGLAQRTLWGQMRLNKDLPG